MAVRAKIESAIFTGVRNGSPHFDFGDHTAPPDWLIKLANAGIATGDGFKAYGKTITPGTEVTRAEWER